MTKSERIEILLKVEVIATTMKDISEEFLKVPTTPSNIDSHLELAHLLTKLMKATKSLADTITNMK
jgi:hypothetical protein